MAKDRNAVTCNGRTALYACMYEDIRQCAMDCGWAVALHGSLASDMDIMAMPWVDNAVSFKEMVDIVSKLFKDNELSSQYVITYNEKPYNRVVATIPIFGDFYLDISTITADVVPKSEAEKLKIEIEALKIANEKMYAANKEQEAKIDTLQGVKSEYEKFIGGLKPRIDNVKADDAREIFAELENILDSMIKLNYSISVQHEEPLERAKAISAEQALRAFRDYLAELKKKYTGGGTEWQ